LRLTQKEQQNIFKRYKRNKTMDCVFCEFIGGRKQHKKEWYKHEEEYPVIPLYNNKKFFCFLGIPDNRGESDLLIITKKHIEHFEDLSKKDLNDFTHFIQKISKIIRKNFGDYKLFINSGRNAEQYINHIHFHLMPYNKNKKPLWTNLTLKKYEKLSHKLKDLLKHIH
jgi:diadenosine tetraphosphate (Ap4A) HIT family hydrolase